MQAPSTSAVHVLNERSRSPIQGAAAARCTPACPMPLAKDAGRHRVFALRALPGRPMQKLCSLLPHF